MLSLPSSPMYVTLHVCPLKCQVPGITNLGLVPRRVNKVGVIGGGLMGSGIATALILSNYPVFLKEVDEKFAGVDRVRSMVDSHF